MTVPNFNPLRYGHGMPWLVLSMLALSGVAFVAQRMTRIDDTCYISVAWEMWLRCVSLVPFKNEKHLEGIQAKAAQNYLDGMAALLDAPSALNYLGPNGR